MSSRSADRDTHEQAGAPARKSQKRAEQEGLFFYHPGDTCLTYYKQAPGKKFFQVLVMDQYLRNFQESCMIIGTDFYTPESDIVVAALHCNRYKIDALPDKLFGAVIGIQIHTPQRGYISALRNGIRSVSWQGTTEFCFQPLMFKCVWDIKQVREYPIPRHVVLKKHKPRKERLLTSNLQFAFDITNTLRFAYNRNFMFDTGFEEKDWTSTSFLWKVYYFTCGRHQYEMAIQNWKEVNDQWELQQEREGSSRWQRQSSPAVVPKWKWCRVQQKVIEYQLFAGVDSSYKPLPIPLPDHLVIVVEKDLDWQEIAWTGSGVEIRSKAYELSTIHSPDRDEVSGVNDKENTKTTTTTTTTKEQKETTATTTTAAATPAKPETADAPQQPGATPPQN